MNIALRVARGLAQPPLALPAALIDVRTRAAFIDEIDKPLLVDSDGIVRWEQFGAQLLAIAHASVDVMGEVDTELGRISIALVLWSGCLMAAKAIAFETRSGENTAAGRAQQFATIDGLASQDVLFCAGVEAAPAFKTQRAQHYSLEGVPHGSPVRRHVEQAQDGS